MNSQVVYKSMLSEVHNILGLYLMVPITSATSEGSFSELKIVNTYLYLSMSDQRLNNYLLLHIHKDLTDSCDMEKVAKDFIAVNTECRNYFGVFPSKLIIIQSLIFLYSIVSMYTSKIFSCSARREHIPLPTPPLPCRPAPVWQAISIKNIFHNVCSKTYV